MLTSYLGKRVSVITVEGRNLVGILHSADQLLNIVLSSCVERELAPADHYFLSDSTLKEDSENKSSKERDFGHVLKEESVGLQMVRGAEVVSIGTIDVYEEAKENVKEWRGFDMPEAVVPTRYM